MIYAIELTRTAAGKFYANLYSDDFGVIYDEAVTREFESLNELVLCVQQNWPFTGHKITDFHIEK